MRKLSKRELEFIDIDLERYRTINNKINSRRQELIHNKKYDYRDSIMGRGNKPSNPTENTIIRIEEDLTLRNLEAFKLLVETLMTRLIDVDLTIFKMRFLKENATWDNVAEELNKSNIYINRRRQIIAQEFEKLKGF